MCDMFLLLYAPQRSDYADDSNSFVVRNDIKYVISALEVIDIHHPLSQIPVILNFHYLELFL